LVSRRLIASHRASLHEPDRVFGYSAWSISPREKRMLKMCIYSAKASCGHLDAVIVAGLNSDMPRCHRSRLARIRIPAYRGDRKQDLRLALPPDLRLDIAAPTSERVEPLDANFCRYGLWRGIWRNFLRAAALRASPVGSIAAQTRHASTISSPLPIIANGSFSGS